MSWITLFCCLLTPLLAVIYGPDDRQDVWKNPLHRKLAQSVAIAVPSQFLRGTELTLVETLAESSSIFACPTERFAQQPTIGNCTGFLISRRHILTAGHCVLPNGVVTEEDQHPFCAAFSWVFNFQTTPQGKTFIPFIPETHLYRCQKILRAENLELPGGPPGTRFGNDFAVIELDRDVAFPPLILNFSPLLKGSKVFTIGHPSGLPAKFSGLSSLLKVDQEAYVEANLDTQGGNSGSPVFSSEGEVVGILVSGHPVDYVETREGCYQVNTCDSTGKKCLENSRFDFLQVSNYIQRLDQVKPHLPRTSR